MARHESEMHRQRRDLLEALQRAANRLAFIARTSEDQDIRKLAALAHQDAFATIRLIFPRCDVGLFADRSQGDLQDRKDI